MGLVQDWSTRHIVYPKGASLPLFLAARRDPRAFYTWMEATRAIRNWNQNQNSVSTGGVNGPRTGKPTLHRDWSVSLGGGTMQGNMYPAKFTFDVNATPSCPNDFAVFTMNVTPSAAQANIVGLNYLYSGSSPNGICNNLVGNGTSANVNWAYRVGTKAIATSPVISLDGTQIAFVENTTPATFHVLTWTAGQGTVTSPATPAAAQLTSLTLSGGPGDTFSDPFIDYFNHVAYVGTDNGKFFKITNVFNGGTPALAGAPWPVKAGSADLTGPVLDANSGNIFVGSADGRLYGFNSATGAALTGSPILVGNGSSLGGVVDPPIVDSLNGFVYAMSGTNSAGGGAKGVVVQTVTTSIGSLRRAGFGTGGQQNIHAGDFNDAYFSQSTNQIGTTLEWFLYVCGTATGGTNPVLFRIGFDASRNMNTAADGTHVTITSSSEACSPLTDFKNGVDRLFFGVTTTDTVGFFDVSTSTTPALTILPANSFDGGPTGIIVDNVSAQAQASSIYFAQLDSVSGGCGAGNFCAVKLTQSGLQ